MQNVLVTGGAGYIGSHMVRLLKEQNLNPIIFDNLSTGHHEFIPSDTTFIQGDLTKAEDVIQIFEKHSIDAIIHFAGLIIVPESVENPEKYHLHNVEGSLNLINAAVAANVNHFIFSSTASVYGEPENIPVTEEEVAKPTNPYGETKLLIEKALEETAQKHPSFRYICLRYFNACGAHPSLTIGEWRDPETHLIPNIMKSLIGKGPQLKLFGFDYPTKDGTAVRDYIHVNDLVEAHLKALKWLEKGGKSDVFNLGSGQGYSVAEIVKMTEKITQKQVQYEKAARRTGDVPTLVASNSKAQNILDWKPSRNLHAIIESAWQWEQKLLTKEVNKNERTAKMS